MWGLSGSLCCLSACQKTLQTKSLPQKRGECIKSGASKLEIMLASSKMKPSQNARECKLVGVPQNEKKRGVFIHFFNHG